MYKNFLTDVGGVLHFPDVHAIGDDMSVALGLSPDQSQEIWTDLIPRLGVGEFDEVGFWRIIAETYHVRQADASERLLVRNMEAHFMPNRPLLTYVNALNDAGVVTAILSDTNQSHADFLKSKNIYAPFSTVVLSHEVGMRKNSPGIYKLALQRMKAEASETVYIDDRADNVALAHAVGMHALLFKNNQALFQELASLFPGVPLPSTQA